MWFGRSSLVANVNKDKLKKLKLSDPFEPTIEQIKEKVLSLEESALENKEISNSEGAEIAYSKNSFYLWVLMAWT